MVPSDAPSHHNMRENPRNPYRPNPQEEEEEAAAATEDLRLSLCDLPLDPKNGRGDDNNTENDSKRLSNHSPRSHSEPPADFFEFFSDLNSDMCPADDIFFCGKLIPFKEQSPPTTRQTPKISTTERNYIKQTHFRRRYCQPLSKLHSPITRSNSSSSTSKLMTRNSHALDYRKLHRRSHSMISPTPEVERNISVKSLGRSDTALKTAAKPRWYFLMFGMVKFPPEMELGDMKNRQVRRNRPSTLFPAPRDVHGKLPVRRSSSKGFWRLLRALSCKDHSSVAVTASFCFPHV
ncbi:hypothetical protein F2P56_017830 [Juglans regia]|uniref:Uncharacterized protein LOC108991142 n=2 Tax=Juglans regia TaxID=51240 RepID=A0A2I4EN58_JUGRE|nr:uncharacterized protein LOC108991142 [Juglans regia]KAF5461757.1 hypothetical protein F2P56_017830 [Juglans regia]